MITAVLIVYRSMAALRSEDIRLSLPDTPFTYTDFSYESLRIAQIHGSLRFSHFYELLRVITSYLRFITDYYDVFTEKFHDLLRVVTDNYEQLTGILRAFYRLLRAHYGMLLFIEAFTCYL